MTRIENVILETLTSGETLRASAALAALNELIGIDYELTVPAFIAYRAAAIAAGYETAGEEALWDDLSPDEVR